MHPFCNLQSRERTHTVLVICLYELLGNPTTYLIEPPGPFTVGRALGTVTNRHIGCENKIYVLRCSIQPQVCSHFVYLLREAYIIWLYQYLDYDCNYVYWWLLSICDQITHHIGLLSVPFVMDSCFIHVKNPYYRSHKRMNALWSLQEAILSSPSNTPCLASDSQMM